MNTPPHDAALRVLYLLDVLNVVGGTERQLRSLIRNMDPGRYAPSAMTLYDATMPHEADFGGLGCPTSCLGLGSLRSAGTWRAVLDLARQVRHERIGLIHTFFPDAGIIGIIAGRLGGARVIVSRRDLGYWYSPGYLTVLRALHRFADGYLVNSRAVAKVVAESEGVDPARIQVVYNGFFDLPSGPSRFSPADFGFPVGAKIVGTVANLRRVKRLDRFVEMAAGIRDPAARFVIVGYGDEQTALEDQARRAGLDERLRIVHTIPDVLEIVKLFRVGVLTSESEGLSNTLVEYALAGVPGIAFDVGGNREVIDDGETGFLAPPYDVGFLRDRVESVLADDRLRHRMGGRARDVCSSRFAGERMVSETLEIYDRLVRSGR